jgi:hypothetical protein
MNHFETFAFPGCRALCFGSCLPIFRYSLSAPSPGVWQSVNNHQSTLRNNPEERRFQLYRGGTLKSRMKHFVFGFLEVQFYFDCEIEIDAYSVCSSLFMISQHLFVLRHHTICTYGGM